MRVSTRPKAPHGKAREKFREAVAETLTDWRLGRASQRANFSGAEQILAAGIGEIAMLRLTLVFVPLLQSLARIEARAGILADLKPEPYAPPTKRRGEDPLAEEIRLPEYLQPRPR